MMPFAISGISSLANSALEVWDRLSESRGAAKAQPTVNFITVLDKASASGKASNAGASVLQRQLSCLPEVKTMLAAAGPGSELALTVGPDGNLSRVLPGGERQQIPLGAESQAILRQWTGANPGITLAAKVMA